MRLTLSCCRSCGVSIQWCVTEKGERIPMDELPHEDGNMVIVIENHESVARQHLPLLDADLPRYRSHFATCPQADEHRTRTTKKNR